MIAYPITDDIREILKLISNDPVLSEIIKDYKVGNKYIFIPKARINNNKLIKKMVKEKKMFVP